MPAINPNDFNIDKIDVSTRDLTLGVYNTPDFTNYILGRNFTTPTNLQDINIPEINEQVLDLDDVVTTSNSPHPDSISNESIINYNLNKNVDGLPLSLINNNNGYDTTTQGSMSTTFPVGSEQRLVIDLGQLSDMINLTHPNATNGESILDYNLNKNIDGLSPTLSNNNNNNYSLDTLGNQSVSLPTGGEQRLVIDLDELSDMINLTHPNSTNGESYINFHSNMNLEESHYTVIQGGYDLGGFGEFSDAFPTGGEQRLTRDFRDVIVIANTDGVHPSLFNQSPIEYNLGSNLFTYGIPYTYSVDGTDTVYTNTLPQPQEYTVTTFNGFSIEDSGSVEDIINSIGSQTSYDYLQTQLLSNSKYGPKILTSQVSPSIRNTDFVEYQRSAGGTLLDGFVGQQLGFGLASGIDFESELGNIGIEQREFNTKERIRLNFVQETAGVLNLDPFGLATGQDLLWKDYKISRAKGFLGRAAQFTANLTGINTQPFERTVNNILGRNSSSEDRSNYLLERTGGATRGLIYDAISQNLFGPVLGEEKNVIGGEPESTKEKKFLGRILDEFTGGEAPDAIGYTGNLTQEYDKLTDPEEQKEVQKINTDDFGDTDGIYWDKNRVQLSPSTTKRGLLKFTQSLINNNEDINALISKENHDKVSQGNQVKSSDGTYCRSWSTTKRYDTYSDLVRNDELLRSFMAKGLTILQDGTGLPKIVPYKDDYNWETESLFSTGDPSKYMLSLENLAWEGSREFNVLPNVEKGPNGGRIMWFPPYDINFTDNTSVSWETTNFIGRPEPIYTYNHTERKGTLDFKIIIDHPSGLNVIKEDTKDILEEYFAGCDDLGLFKNVYGNTIFTDDATRNELINDGNELISQIQVPEPKPYNQDVIFYFQNSPTEGDKTGRDVVFDLGQGYELGSGELNSTFSAQTKQLIDFLLTPDGKRYRINIESNTSGSASKEYNQTLSEDRTNSLREYLFQKLVSAEKGRTINYPVRLDGRDISFYKENENKTFRWGKLTSNGESNSVTDNTTRADDISAKRERNARITLEYNPEIDDYMLNTKLPKGNEGFINNRKRSDEENARRIADDIVNEATYFTKLTETDSFIYEDLKDKIEFFHPAFHSMTPEGFNGRLSFLQQCTRQGPTVEKNSPRNMAFGKPPVCVLRIGDFYHTKIVIDAVNFTFDPLQWDLNPEGVGVQPMLCSVSLSFSFIGGSSLGGPISQLQNAVSENFFANTSIHRRRKRYEDSNGNTFEYGAYTTPKEQLTKEERQIETPTAVADVPQEPGTNTNTKQQGDKPAVIVPLPDDTTTNTTSTDSELSTLRITDNTKLEFTQFVLNELELELEVDNGFSLESDYRSIVIINDNSTRNTYRSTKPFKVSNTGTSFDKISLDTFVDESGTKLSDVYALVKEYSVQVDLVNEFSAPIKTLEKTL